MHLHLSTWPKRLLARPWLLVFVPINAATSGFGVALPLLILLRFHGDLLDVALAAVLFNVAVIFASIAWGHLADRYPDRRLFLLVNFLGFGIIYAVLGAFPGLLLLLLLYGVIGLLSPSGTSASNLLILEQFTEAERATAFASFQEMSIFGAIAGVLIGFFWLLAGGGLTPLLFVFAALSLTAGVLAYFGVRDSPRPAEARQIARHPAALVSRLRHSVAFRQFIPFFPHRPTLGPAPLRRLGRWMREEVRHELPLILAAGFLFNFASNLYNTSYTPYLESIGIASAAIFLVNCSNNVAQALAFPASGALATREGNGPLVHQATYVRSVGYLATVAFTLVPLSVAAAFDANAIVFGVLGGAIALYSTASSLLLFRSLKARQAGRIIGLNSALGGVAAVTGALASGLLSTFGSYRLTFLVAGLTLLVSLPLWTLAEVAYDRRSRGVAVARVVPVAPRAPTPVAIAKAD
jgi:MFS family permease